MLDAVEKIEKIKCLRDLYGLSLKEATRRVERQSIENQIKNTKSIEDLKQALLRTLNMMW